MRKKRTHATIFRHAAPGASWILTGLLLTLHALMCFSCMPAKSARLILPGGSVNEIAWSPDGTLIAAFSIETETTRSADDITIESSASKYMLNIWDAATGKAICSAESAYFCNDLRFSMDSKTLFGEGRIWDALTGRLVRSKDEVMANVGQTAISPDLKKLGVAYHDRNLAVLDMASGETIVKMKGKHDKDIMAMRFSPDGNTLFTVSKDRRLMAWEASTGNVLFDYWASSFPIEVLTIAEKSGKLAIGAAEGKSTSYFGITLYHEPDYLDRSLLKGHTHRISALALSDDGALCLSGGMDKTIKLWDTQARKQLALYKGHSGPIKCLSISPDGSQFASSAFDDGIRIWPMPKK